MLLDEGLIVSRLGIEHRSFWLELAHSINCLDFSQDDFAAAFLVLNEGAEEISVLWLMKEDGRLVEFVAQCGYALVILEINISQ